MHPAALQLRALAASAFVLVACGPADHFSTGPRAPSAVPAALEGRVAFQGQPLPGIRLRLVPDPAPRPLDDTLEARPDAAYHQTGDDGRFRHLLGGGGGVTVQVVGLPAGCSPPASARYQLTLGEERFVEVPLFCPRGPKTAPTEPGQE